VALRALPAHDLFSFTAADRAWDSQEWLSQILLYGTWRSVGLDGLIVAKALIAAALCLILVRDAIRSARPAARWLAVGGIAWGAYVMRWHLVERPQMFSMVFLAAELALLRRGTPRWTIAPLTLLWANLHGGSALLGPGILALWLAGEALARGGRRPAHADLLTLGAAVGAIACNPAGWRLFTYPFATMHDAMYMANILEWMPPTFAEQPEFFWWSGAALAAGLAGASAWRLPEAAVCAVTAALALVSRRHIPLAVIAALPPVIRAGASRWPAGGTRWAPMLGLASATACLALAGGRGEALRLGTRSDLYPAAAVSALAGLESAVPGSGPIRVLPLHRWGGYLIWHLPPRFKMFIDGRQLVYGPRLFEEYCRIIADVDHTGELLNRYAPDVLVVEHESGLTTRLAASPAHALVHWDDACRVYVRSATVRPDWLATHRYRSATPGPVPGADPAKVLVELARAAREAPLDGRPWSIRAEFLAAQGRLDEAWTAALKAVRRKPEAVPALLAACRIAALRHDPAEAGRMARRAARADPDGAAPQVALARLAWDRRDPAEAGRDLARAIRTGSARETRTHRPEAGITEAWELTAGLEASAGRPEEAARAWREAGNRWYRDGAFAPALRCYRAGLVVAPADTRLLHNVAAALEELHRPAQAREAWKRVLAADPRDPQARTFLGRAP